MDQERSKEIHSKIRLMRYVGILLLTFTLILLRLITLSHGKGLQTQRFAGFLFFVRVREQSLFHPLLYIGLWLDIIDSLAWSFPFISWHSGVSEAAIKYFWLQEIFMSRSYEQTLWLQQFYQLRIPAERTKTAGIV